VGRAECHGLNGRAAGCGYRSVTAEYALAERRHMAAYGTTSEQLGWVDVQERAWAQLNPRAKMYGRPMSIEDHQNSPLVVEPYHLLDICLVSDGAIAYVVTTTERARDLRRPPAYLLGVAQGSEYRNGARGSASQRLSSDTCWRRRGH